jgi:hypothetical protein
MSASSPLKTMSSPRLRSPRGSSPRNQSPGCIDGFLRHSRRFLVLLAIAVVWAVRPSMDPGTNLSFIDTQAFAFSSLMVPNEPVESSHFSMDAPVLPIDFQPRVSQPPHSDAISKKDTQTKDSDDFSNSPLLDSPQSKSSLLKSYNASLSPVLDKPIHIQVQLIVDVSQSIGPQSKFLLDGLERSAYTEVVNVVFLNPNIKTLSVHERDTSKPLLWMVDWGSMHRDCHRLQRVLQVQLRRPNEPVVLVDYSGSSRQTQCDFWDEGFRLAKRSIVQGRHYNPTKMDRGTLAENTGTPGGPIVHAPLVVREGFVQALFANGTSKTHPLNTKREVDLAFFWKPGDYSHYGFWRRDAANVVQSFKERYTTLIDIVANDEEGMELGNIQSDHVQKLLSSKIVVVAQRDEWEDHYRLLESLASGAMVLADAMLAPPYGLKNKTNVVLYDSPQSLQRLIQYYLDKKNKRRRLSIAKEGYQLAMGRHRCWHRVEQILFGQPLTHVDRPYDKPPAKLEHPEITLLEEDEEQTVPSR